MEKKKRYRFFIEAAAAVVLIALLIFFVGFRVAKVEVEGNKFYTDEAIADMVLDVPIAENSILAMLIKTEEKTKDAEMIERVTLRRKNRNTLVVKVKEKKMIGYFELDGKCANFDRQGIIQIITEKPLKDVPLIDGLNAKAAKQGEKLAGINRKKLNTILSVGKMLEKTEHKPDRLVFNEMKQLVLYYGEIEVRLGDDESMDEKMNRLIGILPELQGMKGILHLENVTETTEAVVFDDLSMSQEDEEQEGMEGEEDTEDTEEDIENQEGIDMDEEEIGAGEEASEGEMEGDMQYEEEDGEEDGTGDESSELDYSDGSDAAEE